jgi:hypothetical protein
MRQLGAGMEDLKGWISAREGSSTAYSVLARLRDRLQRHLDLDRDRLQYIDHCIQCALLWQNRRPVELLRPTARPIPDMPVFALRDRVSTVGQAVYRMFESAERAVAAQSARAPQRPFLLIHHQHDRNRRADVEVCIPILPASLSALRGRVVEGAPSAACLSFQGSYDQVPCAVTVLENWIRITGARAAGPLRETYIQFGADQRGYRLPPTWLAAQEADFLTELQIPTAGG